MYAFIGGGGTEKSRWWLPSTTLTFRSVVVVAVVGLLYGLNIVIDRQIDRHIYIAPINSKESLSADERVYIMSAVCLSVSSKNRMSKLCYILVAL